MEELYRTGEASGPIDRLREWTDHEEFDQEEIDLQTWMLDGYFDKWGFGDPQFVNGAVETEFEALVDLPDVGMGPLKLMVIVDLLVEQFGKLWVVDHKSGGAYGKPKPTALEMADQWTLYVWAMRQLGYEVFGSLHNFATTKKLQRTMTLDERFYRTPIHRTERECEQVVREFTIQAWAARVENGAPRSPGDHCIYRCGFFDHCVADRRYGGRLADNILTIKHRQREEEQ